MAKMMPPAAIKNPTSVAISMTWAASWNSKPMAYLSRFIGQGEKAVNKALHLPHISQTHDSWRIGKIRLISPSLISVERKLGPNELSAGGAGDGRDEEKAKIKEAGDRVGGDHRLSWGRRKELHQP